MLDYIKHASPEGRSVDEAFLLKQCTKDASLQVVPTDDPSIEYLGRPLGDLDAHAHIASSLRDPLVFREQRQTTWRRRKRPVRFVQNPDLSNDLPLFYQERLHGSIFLEKFNHAV